ncbi:MAG TPA: HD domain-containing protein [Acidobacteriota bacterium]|nr:HD domain-containing protein [Acidobacteriota bacterium]
MESIRLGQILTIADAAGKSEGVSAYLVGGSVRRLLAGRRMSDLDVVVDAPRGASRLAEILSQKVPYAARPVAVGSFPMVEVRCGDISIQISEPLRNITMDISGLGGPLSDAMKQDVLRRDFTVNTLLCPVGTPAPENIIDALGYGLSDFERRILRTPLEPQETIGNDPIRMLRAVRFSNLEGFAIDPALAAAIRAGAPKITTTPGERINMELSKILMGSEPSEGIRALVEHDLLRFTLPELSDLAQVEQPTDYHGDDVLSHTLKVLDNTKPELRLRLAALMHDLGKKSTKTEKEGRVVFHGHQYTGASEAKRVLQRLRYPAKLVDEVAAMVEMHMVAYRQEWSDTAVRRFIRKAGEQLDDLMELYRADILARKPPHDDLAEFEDLKKRIDAVDAEEIRKIASPLSGDEVMEILDLEPGPEVGNAIEAIESAIVDGKLTADSQAARNFLLKEFVSKRMEGQPGE